MRRELFQHVVELSAQAGIVGRGDHRALGPDHLAQQIVHLRFPSLPGDGAGHEVYLFHAQHLKARLLLESLGVEFDRAAVYVEKPEGRLAVVFPEVGDGWRVGPTAHAMLPAAAQILVAEIADRLVSALVLVFLLLYLVRDNVDLFKVQSGLHDGLVVIQNLCFPIVGICLPEVYPKIEQAIVPCSLGKALSHQGL